MTQTAVGEISDQTIAEEAEHKDMPTREGRKMKTRKTKVTMSCPDIRNPKINNSLVLRNVRKQIFYKLAKDEVIRRSRNSIPVVILIRRPKLLQIIHLRLNQPRSVDEVAIREALHLVLHGHSML
jgi:hypothetical protein